MMLTNPTAVFPMDMRNHGLPWSCYESELQTRVIALARGGLSGKQSLCCDPLGVCIDRL